ncbi:MAG: glutathione S-transferase [Polyangiaceae bacterium]
MAPTTPRYELYYWPTIQGRGEFVRLALEAAGATYDDVARRPEKDGGGVPALIRVLQEGSDEWLPFAPPVLRFDGVTVSQTAAILDEIAPTLRLVRSSKRALALAYQLTVADFVSEVHDTHHPVSPMLHYEDQVDAAKSRARAFRAERMPKYLRYFERVLERGSDDGPWLFGDEPSYVDLSLFQLISGLRYAFPNATERFVHEVPHLLALAERVNQVPNIARYLASERRLPFNQNGIFRHYPELDP